MAEQQKPRIISAIISDAYTQIQNSEYFLQQLDTQTQTEMALANCLHGAISKLKTIIEEFMRLERERNNADKNKNS